MLALILAGTSLCSLGAVALAALFLLLPEKARRSLVPAMVSYAVGTLLGASFLGLIPHAQGEMAARSVGLAVVGGIAAFFLLEKAILIHHCHDHECEVHGPVGALILVGDAVHNFVDGVTIAAAFLNSPVLGAATAWAIAAHEIPRELGDFAVLLAAGWSRGRALLWTVLCALPALAGAATGYYGLSALEPLIPVIMALAAGGFIYVAMSDLIPHLQRSPRFGQGAAQMALIAAGLATIFLFDKH
jgi:zinc and cadmium transporter